MNIPGHTVTAVLRETRLRYVMRTTHGVHSCVTRVLCSVRVAPHFARLVRVAVLDGRGSFAALGDEIAMTLEGYAVAARLLGPPGDPPAWIGAVDAGVTDEGHVFVSTRWVEGEPLHELAAALDTRARELATRSLLQTVVRLHERSVAHGDLKLANIILRADGGVCLIDLDTLREVPGPDIGAPTRDHTESWAAPEQRVRQETFLGSDLWAVSRVIQELWGAELPPEWAPALQACRRPDPARRPTAKSLIAHLADPAAPVVDHTGEAVILGEPAAPHQDFGTGGSTERVSELASHTERVEDLVSRPEAPPRSRPPSEPPPTHPGSKGLAGFAFGFGQIAALAALGLVVLCASPCLIGSFLGERRANAAAESVLAELKVHKTDPARNGATERKRLAESAEEAWELAHTPRSCAVRALAMVWQQRWHFDADWSPTDFASASAAVNEVGCAGQPEAELARATLYAGACRRRNGTGPIATEDCLTAISAAQTALRGLAAGEERHWLRLEVAWQEVRARSALATRYAEIGSAEEDTQWREALARCAEAEAWRPFAPVNGPELLEECLVVAGGADDVAVYLQVADELLAALPTDRAARRRMLGKLYTSGGPGCGDARLSWSKRGVLTVEAAPWCSALGHTARGCPKEAAVALAQGSVGDAAHPWDALAASLATRTRCLE